jgi:PAS domain S-box-containing protein
VEELQRIIRRLPLGVWVASVPAGTVLYTNDAFEVIMGRAAGQQSRIDDAPATYGILDRAGNLYPVEQLPFSRVVRTRAPVMVDDLVIARPDGTRIDVRSYAHPLFDDAGTLTHVSVAFIDITREVRAEAERDRSAERLTMAVEHSPIMVWSLAADGTITLCVGAALEALGTTSSEQLGKNAFELYRDSPDAVAALRRVFSGETLQQVVQVGEAVFDIWMKPVKNAEGRVVEVTGVSHDIRELRRLEAAGIQSERAAALGTLAASVAHEINNPLTYMLAHSEQLAASIVELEALGERLSPALSADLLRLCALVRQDAQIVQSGTERIATITRALHTFSRPDDEASVPVDARAAVHSALELIGKELEAHATVVLELGATAPVLGQPTRLVQVILNLVMNATQSLPPSLPRQHEVRIRTATVAGDVIIEVADSGPGIPLTERERIFEPFVTTKPIGEGSGLGLFVCRNIVRGFGGNISAHDGPRGGALFRVTLPAPSAALPTSAALPAPAPPASRPRPPAPPSANVVIIDDDARVANVLSTSLKRAGYRVTVCAAASAGLERLLSGEDVDLVFCDLMMQGMSGMDLHAALRERAPQLLDKCVFMTGGAYSPAARQFMREHANDIVEKPFNILAEAQRRLGDPR